MFDCNIRNFIMALRHQPAGRKAPDLVRYDEYVNNDHEADSARLAPENATPPLLVYQHPLPKSAVHPHRRRMVGLQAPTGPSLLNLSPPKQLRESPSLVLKL